ncbi:hypothetical protein MNBD_BACTEROID06-807 [hydrothermal vent metagenome]|uniref:Uncharacterized protein n=1 Tax=hydrothermal vent metagenome TaxID=652676 RepID=A0A3B0U8S6_9ZZZZ
MTKHLSSLLVGTLFSINLLAQNYTCSTLDNISEINLTISEESNFVIFAEDSHSDNLRNKEFAIQYLQFLNQNGFNSLALELGVAYEYVSGLGDTTTISGLIGPLNYKFIRNVHLYNYEKPESSITIRGFDVETYFPFALKILGFIFEKYASKSNELNKLLLASERVNKMGEGEVQNNSIIELTASVKNYVVRKNEGVLSSVDSIYLYKIADGLENGVLFNFKDWNLRENKIFKNIELLAKNPRRKYVLLVGSQHVDKKVYRKTPSFYTRMLTAGILKPEIDTAPVIIFRKDENIDDRLGLYKISKEDYKLITEYLTQNAGMIYCKDSKPESSSKSYLFYD